MAKEIVKVLKFGSLQSGWEGINEYLYTEAKEIEKRGGGSYGPEWVSYNNYVVMKRAWVDPEFNFGRVLGYAIKKWSALVNNYVDFKYLDMVRAEIGMRVNKNARSYNHAYHFDNSHGSGKDCLISLNFTKRIGIEHPIVVFTIRTSEVTKRLLFDFLLVQRIIEYVYGHNDAEVHLFAPSFYITAESFLIYNNVRDIFKLTIPEHESTSAGKFHKRVADKFEEFYNHPDPMEIKYKVNRRSAMQIQRGEDGRPLSGVKDMFAKNLVLKPKEETIKYPKNIISKSQRKAWKRTITQKSRN